MATANYDHVPGAAVFVVKAASFGIAKAQIVSVQISANPLLVKYNVAYDDASRPPAVVLATEVFGTLLDAWAEYETLIT